jgi:tetratricopeptide (TPR) repeat protein
VGQIECAVDTFGAWLTQQINRGSAELAFALLERQRRTMGRLLGLALSEQRYDLAQQIMQPLDDFWDLRGLRTEACGWVDRCCAALEDRQGTPPALDSPAGALWLFAVGSEANRALRARELDTAYARHDAIRQRLEASPATEQQQRLLAIAYHQLGRVAQERGDLAAAEAWYRKSLEIREALGAPYISLATDGKEPSLQPFGNAIAKVVRKVCKAAWRAIAKPPDSMSFKEAAWSVMPEAYRIASANGSLPANVRQIMYAARPAILKLTGKEYLDDNYFTQHLLRDYVETAIRVHIAFAAACPEADLFRRVARSLQPTGPITAGASALNTLCRQPSTPDMTNRRSRTTRYGQTLPSLSQSYERPCHENTPG